MPNLTAKENVEIAVEMCKDHLDPQRCWKKWGLRGECRTFRRSFPAANSRG